MDGISKAYRKHLNKVVSKPVILIAALGIGGAFLLVPKVPTALAATPAASTVMLQAQPGEALFKAKCQMCHSVVAGKKSAMGPNLRGVVGRKAATDAYAAYSPKLKAFGKVWTPELLDQWMQSPTKMVPGTRMIFAVPDAKQRKDIAAYLASQK